MLSCMLIWNYSAHCKSAKICLLLRNIRVLPHRCHILYLMWPLESRNQTFIEVNE